MAIINQTWSLQCEETIGQAEIMRKIDITSVLKNNYFKHCTLI
jgi:hypothetical protein